MSITSLALLCALSALPGSALPIEVGGIAGGGLCFTFGSYLDARASQLAAQGMVGTTPGSSTSSLFPGMSAGGYGEIGLLPWLDLRVELRVSYLGALRLAKNGAGLPFDAYGIGYYAVILPVLARGVFPLGPGRITVDLGPLYGLIAGGVKEADAYSGVQTSAIVATGFVGGSMIGLAGGAGYQLGLGPGLLGVELRADTVLFPAKLSTGLASGDIAPLNAILVVSYGFVIGRPQ